MQQVDVIINQVAGMLILALLGYLAGRKGYLPQNSGLYVSNIVIKITAPSLIITTMAAYDFTDKTIKDGLTVSFYTLLFMMMAGIIGFIASRLLKLKGSIANVFCAHSMFGNVGYLGMPLLKSIFGEKGLVYAIFFIIVHDLIIWTLGVYLLNRHGEKTWRENVKQIFNANTLSFLLGLIFAFINLQQFVKASPLAGIVYNVLYNTLNPLGNATLYLVMIFIGLTLSENKGERLKELFYKKTTLFLLFIKLLLIPAAAFAILFMPGVFIDPFVRTILILELAMPCGAIIPALALRYGSDYKLASDNVVYSTFFFMITLPLFLYLLNIAGG